MDEDSEPRSSPPMIPGPSRSAGEGAEQAPPPTEQRTLLGGLTRYFQQVGRDVLSVALGRLAEPPNHAEPADQAGAAAAEPQVTSDSTYQRVRVLHDMAEKLRGAADKYITVKLDEIEARVDAKLDHIEGRIDSKIVELHEQLREMRDRELRHRLRLLKVTLVFTVLVALLSLGYKWLSKYWFA